MTLNMLNEMVSVLDSGTGADLVCKIFLLVEGRDHLFPIHNMSFKRASNSPVNAIGMFMHFVHLCDLHLLVQFSVLDNLAVLLQIGT